MPWNVRKKGSKFVVVKKNGKVVGTHDSREQALKQQAALYSSEKKGKMSGRRKS